jgi:hypothetical protein
LAEGWQGLGQAEKDAVQVRFETLKTAEKENGIGKGGGKPEPSKVVQDAVEQKDDEDVEMGDDATGTDASGFTAVNRG